MFLHEHGAMILKAKILMLRCLLLMACLLLCLRVVTFVLH
jgi:hypothetical protein